MKLGLKGKLLAGFGLTLVFTATVGLVGTLALNKVSHHYSHVAKINLGNAISLGDMNLWSTQVTSDLRQLGFPNLSPEQIEKYSKAVQNDIEKYQAADKAYNDVEFVEGEEALYKVVNESWKHQREVALQIVDLAKKSDPASRSKLSDLILGDYTKYDAENSEALDRLTRFQVDQSKTWVGNAEQAERTAKWFSSILLAVAVVSGLGIALGLSQSITKKLDRVVQELSKGAVQITSASTELSHASTELSSSTTQQSSATQETAAAVQEMSAMILRNTESSEKSKLLAFSSQQSAEKGHSAVREMIGSMDEINQSNTDIFAQIEKSNHEISEIVTVINEIAGKTKVIHDIVFQTKLLSFNASVEAARAGEHGKGFAVVAEEVGNLAQMSGRAAKEIGDLLNSSITKVESIVHSTKSKVVEMTSSAQAKVEKGGVTAKRCGEILQEIVTNVAEVTRMVGDIATASNEQSNGVTQIGQAMGQLDEATQQNATAAQQASKTAEQLATQAVELKALVAGLMEISWGEAKELSSSTAEKRPEAPSPKNVVAFVPRKSAAPQRATQSAPQSEPAVSSRKIVGGEPIPNESDSRFVDV
ncbi:MAG: methyl-accepting chemotaxis protein [Bdellovibrionia bacterium]